MNYGMIQLSCPNFWLTEDGRVATIVGIYGDGQPVIVDHSNGRQYIIQKDHTCWGPLEPR